MEEKLYDTNVEMKAKYWDAFVELVKDQWAYGGIKYGENDAPGGREATDILCEAFGLNGLLWTVGKYLLRFRNQKREKDLLKIACYCFLIWLKHGFQAKESHDTDTAGSEKR